MSEMSVDELENLTHLLGFPKDWQIFPIESLCLKVTSGGTPSRKNPEFYKDGKVIWLKTQELKDWYIEDSQEKITEEALKKSSAKLLPVNTVLMAMYGDGRTITSLGILRKEAATNQACCALVPNLDICEPLYLFYLLKFHRNHLIKLALGGAQRNLSGTIIRNFKVKVPPLPIQRKIVGVLSAYDDLIENNTRRIEILEEMARSLYREWFVNFRFPGHEQVKMVDSELGLIPEGWEVKPLSDVCSRITDGSHWSPKTVDEGYPMASVKDMHNWGFHIKQCRKISAEDYETLVKNDCKPLKNDILVAKDGSYLKHIFVIEKELDMVILSSIALLRPNNKIISHILSLYLLEPSIKARMAGYVSGAALPRIILKDFRKFLIVLPPIDLQNKFFSLAEPMIMNCYRLIEKNANLCQTRNLLLPKLISGEIDVENLGINTGEIAA